MYAVSKIFGHDRGLSCVFRQWRADSHCARLHGYAISVRLDLECETLDENNWVYDFGRFKAIKKWLEETFDHKLLVAVDDPAIDDLTMLQQLNVADVLVVEKIGCETFAKMCFTAMSDMLTFADKQRGVRVVSCEVREHGSNGASYRGE